MQSLLDTLFLLSATVCTIAALIAGCGKKKAQTMTEMPATGGDNSKQGPPAAPAPAAPAPAAAAGEEPKTPSKIGTPSGAAKTPSAMKPVAPATNPADQSDKKKAVPGAVADDGGYENCKDMSPEELKKALV